MVSYPLCSKSGTLTIPTHLLNCSNPEMVTNFGLGVKFHFGSLFSQQLQSTTVPAYLFQPQKSVRVAGTVPLLSCGGFCPASVQASLFKDIHKHRKEVLQTRVKLFPLLDLKLCRDKKPPQLPKSFHLLNKPSLVVSM